MRALLLLLILHSVVHYGNPLTVNSFVFKRNHKPMDLLKDLSSMNLSTKSETEHTDQTESVEKKFSNEDVLTLNQQLLDSIASGDYVCYQKLCADDLTCFEPESAGMLVEGLDFHKYYFDLGRKLSKPLVKTNITMSNPHVRWLGIGHAAVVSYTRIDQAIVNGEPVTKTKSETRIWEVRDSALVHVHFHKS